MDLRSRTVSVAATLSLVVSLAACSAGATPMTQEQAKKATCEALQTWSDSMRALTTIAPGQTSATQIAALRQDVEKAWDGVTSNLANVTSANKAAVEAGWASLETALKNIPADATPADVVTSVKTAAEPLRAAYQELGTGLGCVFVTPY